MERVVILVKMVFMYMQSYVFFFYFLFRYSLFAIYIVKFMIDDFNGYCMIDFG